MKLPNHIGIIPDGSRRWADAHGLSQLDGWGKSIGPGLMFFKHIREVGIKEVTYFPYSLDNAQRRPPIQSQAILEACLRVVDLLSREDVELLVIGKSDAPAFPQELLPYTTGRKTCGKGGLKVNFLINYRWDWDLGGLLNADPQKPGSLDSLRSREVSMLDLILRWGGCSRLSGFLPVQSVYAAIYVLDDLWPDCKPDHLDRALQWYAQQDSAHPERLAPGQ